MIRFVEPTLGPLVSTVINHPAVGPLVIVTDHAGSIVKVEWGSGESECDDTDNIVVVRVKQYLAGNEDIDLTLALRGLSQLQLNVVKAIAAIPRGKVLSYGAVAAAVGCRSVRAVATAVGRNPLPVIVPCHRVLPAGGAAKWNRDPQRVLVAPKLLGHYTPDDKLKISLLSSELNI